MSISETIALHCMVNSCNSDINQNRPFSLSNNIATIEYRNIDETKFEDQLFIETHSNFSKHHRLEMCDSKSYYNTTSFIFLYEVVKTLFKI